MLSNLLLLSALLRLAHASLYSPFRPTDLTLTHNSRQTTAQRNTSTEYWFDQLIDHNDASKGTFKQRYFFSDEHWTGNGAPVIINTPGEQSADGADSLLTINFLSGTMMELYGAAGVVLERKSPPAIGVILADTYTADRYWGKSSPYQNLTTEALAYLTVDQAIQDFVYFAQTVQLPFIKASNVNTNPSSTPWVHIGCSYPGMLAAFTQEQHSDVFAAAWATSAPVQADGDFWEYFLPVQEGMPQNCSSDLSAAVAYIDNALATGTPSAQTELKTSFGLGNLTNDDFGLALQYPLGTWQDLQAFTYAQEGESDFYQFCDAIEVLPDGTNNTAETGVGMPQALYNWAALWQQLIDVQCPGTGGACLSSHNYSAPRFTDTSVSDTYQRAWAWLLCNELGWFTPGDVGGSSSIILAAIDVNHYTQECNYMFPTSSGTPGNFNLGADSNATDSTFKGWNLMAKNLFVVNGEFDPWRSASLSSNYAPKFVDTPTQDINVIPGAHHCWDFYLPNAELDANVNATRKEGLGKVYGWLGEWYGNHPNVPNVLPALPPDITTGGSAATATATTSVSDLQNKLDNLEKNKHLALASYILNLVLLFALIGLVVALVLIRRKAGNAERGAASIPMLKTRWNDGDDLGEYGSGSSNGGRGKYRKVALGGQA